MKISFYQNCKIQFNHYIQNISDYLSNLNEEIMNLTTCKDFLSDEDNFSIRVNVNQLGSDLASWNYVEIQNDNIIRYYFVSGFRCISESIYEFNLTIDTVNTYQTDLFKTDNFRQVKINRRHKNRWKIGYDGSYYRIYDKVDEGLGDVATEIEENRSLENSETFIVTRSLQESESTNYLIDMNRIVNEVYFSTSIDTNVSYYTTINVEVSNNSGRMNALLMCPDNPNTLISSYLDFYGIEGHNCVFNTAMLFQKLKGTATNPTTWLLLGYIENGVITFTYELSLGTDSSTHPLKMADICSSDNFTIFKSEHNTATTSISLGKQYLVSDIINNYETISATKSIKSITIPSIDIVNKLDSTIKQITAVPFTITEITPLNYLNSTGILTQQMSTSEGHIYVNNSLGKITKSVEERQKKYESKLYGSYVRNSQIVYDTFSLAVQPEFYNEDISYLDYTTYKPIDATNSVAIKITNLKEQELNSNVLTCNRNNTITTWTNEYLEYVRNGYNYDNKSKSLQNIKNGLNIGSNVLGTILNLGTASKTNSLGLFGGIQSGVQLSTGIANSIISNKENNLALKQKRQNLINTSPTVNGSDNYLLFKTLNNGNCFRYVITKPNEDVETNIWNLFYFTGYADNLYYDEMPTIKSRVYFNYLEADINYVNLNDRKEQERLKDAFSQGITFEWNYNDTWLMEGNLYENWETQF